jgi:hypothetical protein
MTYTHWLPNCPSDVCEQFSKSLYQWLLYYTNIKSDIFNYLRTYMYFIYDIGNWLVVYLQMIATLTRFTFCNVGADHYDLTWCLF